MFTALYIRNSRINNVEKLIHLTQKTPGEAREKIQNTLLTNVGFIKKFENQRIQLDTQLKTLFNLLQLTQETGCTTKRLQRTVNNVVTHLNDLESDSWDLIVMYLCSSKLLK